MGELEGPWGTEIAFVADLAGNGGRPMKKAVPPPRVRSVRPAAMLRIGSLPTLREGREAPAVPGVTIKWGPLWAGTREAKPFFKLKTA